jgi:hypothetical protein
LLAGFCCEIEMASWYKRKHSPVNNKDFLSTLKISTLTEETNTLCIVVFRSHISCVIECNQWKREKRHECANMGKVKDKNYYDSCTARHFWFGTLEISGRWIFFSTELNPRPAGL